MNKTNIVILLLFAALAVLAAYSALEIRELHSRSEALATAIEELQEENAQLREQVTTVQATVENSRTTGEAPESTCDTIFPTGIYRLSTSTSYGPAIASEYDIYHVSVSLGQWGVNTGMRVNMFGLPTDFYFDYNGDGRIDTAIAARFVREIPIAGNSIADRMLADSKVHQSLYAVFSCEWRNAQYTSAEDINNSVTGTSKMLWDLVQENSAALFEWIGSE